MRRAPNVLRPGILALTLSLVSIASAQGPGSTANPAESTPAPGSLEDILTTLGELVVGGGVLMIPIALASILTLGLAIERLWALRRARVLPREVWARVRGALEGGDVEGARRHASADDSSLGRMLAAGLDRWEEGTPEVLGELEEAGQREADELNTHLPALQGIASVAPLLGLLGTVVGMIRSFYTIAKEHVVGNPELFAEPIGQALVTTAAGLSVAIPAMILYYWFKGRIRKLVRGLDQVSRECVALSRRQTRDEHPAGVRAPFDLATGTG